MAMTTSPESNRDRAAWMRLLSLAPWRELETLAGAIADHPHKVLRAPETGMIMLRGRMGSTGAPFNFGEATVTRCAVRLDDGHEGHAYIMGRNGDHAKLAAICDGLLQSPQHHAALSEQVLKPLQQLLVSRHATDAAKAAATKVDFFTMVRGDV